MRDFAHLKKHLKIAKAIPYRLALAKVKNYKEVGPLLVKHGLDNSCDGFWLWFIQEDYEYYSPKFREVLGFEDENDFPNTPDSWRKQINPEYLDKALADYLRHVETKGEYGYLIPVEYNKKHGGTVKLLCEGEVVDWFGAQPVAMLGTHTILDQP